MITVEGTRQKLQRKIRKVCNNALPDLLAIGTSGQTRVGQLDAVIDGLDRKLCKSITRGYPEIMAAALIEQRRSEDPLSDEKSAAKARKKAIKTKLKREASAAEARERLNKGADMDTMITIAKSVIAGKPSAFTKRDFFLELQKRADQQRRPRESREQAFTRYATTDTSGQILMQAHKAAGGEDYCGEPEKANDDPVTNEAFRRLMDLAAEQRREGETVEQAFARLHADPKYRDLVATEKCLHSARVAKALWGSVKAHCGGAIAAMSRMAEVWLGSRKLAIWSWRCRFLAERYGRTAYKLANQGVRYALAAALPQSQE